MYTIIYNIEISNKELIDKFVDGDKIRILDHIIDSKSNAICLEAETIDEICNILTKYKNIEILKLNQITN